MQIRKRLLALFLSVATIFTCTPYAAMAADDDEWSATGQFGETANNKNLKTYTEASHYACVTTERAGRGGIALIPKNIYREILSIDVADSAAPAAGGNVYVEVDYYDEHANGMFMIRYNSAEEKMKQTRIIYTKGENKWKTAGFVLYAPTFRTDTCLGDFIITTSNGNQQSIKDIVIGGVRVKNLDTMSSSDVNIKFSKDPRNYYEGEQLEFTVDFKNKVAEKYDLDLTIEVIDNYDKLVATYEDKVSLNPMKTTSKTFTPEFGYYGRHWLIITGRNEELGYEVQARKEFTYSVKSEYMNDRFGTITHIGFNQIERDPDIIYPMMVNAGIGWSRDEIRWAEVEKTKGVYELMPHHESLVNRANHYGIELLLIYGNGNELYAGAGNAGTSAWHNGYPTTPEGYEAFGNYIYNLIKLLDGRVKHFEYWNEYGWGGADYDKYPAFAKAMYEATMRADPEAYTVGICSAGTGAELIDLIFPLGSGKHMDDVSYHFYTPGDPYSSGVLDNSIKVREALEKHEDGKDKKVWLTEMGGSSVNNSYNDLAHFMVKEYALHYQKTMVEKMFVYDFADDGVDNTYDEHHFGITEHFRPSYENRFLAKPSYITIANLNDKLGTPIHKETLMFNDDITQVYHYERTQDGQDVAIAWSQKENEVISLDFGSKVEIYDTVGNLIETSGEDGQCTLSLGSRPVLIVGEFEKVKEGKPAVVFSETNLQSPERDKASVTIYKTSVEPMTVEVGELPEDSTVKVLNQPKFNGKIANLELEFNGSIGGVEEIPVTVTTESGYVAYDGVIRVEYVEGLKVSGRSHMYRDDDPKHWKLALDIVSNYREKDLTATLDIIEPKVLAQKNIKLGKLTKGENHVEFHLHSLNQFSSYLLKAKIKLENGEEEMVEFPIDFAVAYKAKEPPKIDGILDEGEWDNRGIIVSNLEDQVVILEPEGYFIQPWRGVNDLSSKAWIQWDEDNIYMAYEVTDDVHHQPYDGGLVWNADSVQIGVAFVRTRESRYLPEGAPASSYTEIGFALSDDNKPTLYKYSVEEGAPWSLDNSEVSIKRAGNKAYYELRLAWEDILVPNIEIKENMEICYSFLVNDSDRNGRRGWIEFGAGIGMVKSVLDMARIRLMSGDLN